MHRSCDYGHKNGKRMQITKEKQFSKQNKTKITG